MPMQVGVGMGFCGGFLDFLKARLLNEAPDPILQEKLRQRKLATVWKLVRVFCLFL